MSEGENNDRVGMERALTPHGNERGAQSVKVFRQEMAVALQEGNREKVRTARDIAADVVRHDGEFAAFVARSKDKM